VEKNDTRLDPARIEWVGDSREVLQRFPKGIRFEFGGEIWKLQIGERPTNFRPMKSIGKRVFELRQRDQAGWYRIIYLSKMDKTIYMLHSFVKKSAKTSRKDLNIAETRLKAVKALLQEKKQHGKD